MTLLGAYRVLSCSPAATGDLLDQRTIAHVSMACRWPPVATCHRANFCSVVDSKWRILATRLCAKTEHCEVIVTLLARFDGAQEIEQLAYEHLETLVW